MGCRLELCGERWLVSQRWPIGAPQVTTVRASEQTINAGAWLT